MSAPTDPKRNIRIASSLLLLKALFLVVVPLVFVCMDFGGIDTFGRVAAAVMISVGAYLLAAAILVRKERRLGRILAWVLLPIFALGFPIGTILSVATMYNLEQGKSILK